jgi:hypothetical protein
MTILNYCFDPNCNLFESRVMVRLREKRGAYRVLAGKHEGKRPLGRWVRAWKDIIKIGLKEVADLALCIY